MYRVYLTPEPLFLPGGLTIQRLPGSWRILAPSGSLHTVMTSVYGRRKREGKAAILASLVPNRGGMTGRGIAGRGMTGRGIAGRGMTYKYRY